MSKGIKFSVTAIFYHSVFLQHYRPRLHWECFACLLDTFLKHNKHSISMYISKSDVPAHHCPYRPVEETGTVLINPVLQLHLTIHRFYTMFAPVNCYTISSAVECTYAVFHADGTSIKKPFRILYTRLQGATILPTGCHYTIHNAPQRDAE